MLSMSLISVKLGSLVSYWTGEKIKAKLNIANSHDNCKKIL